jgi:hypothetical protein
MLYSQTVKSLCLDFVSYLLEVEVREELKGQDLSFTEIAKVVGERWQMLRPEVRENCEQQANSAKEKYYAELAEYKRTPEYQQYQEYLVGFKARYGPARSGESKIGTTTYLHIVLTVGI